MPPYTHHPNTNIERRMKIEHTTYDEVHAMPTKRPKTGADKIKDLFSKSQKKESSKTVRFDLPNAPSRNATRTEPGQVHIGLVLAQEESRFRRERRERKAYEQAIEDVKNREKPAGLAAHVPLYDLGSNKPAVRSNYQVLGNDGPRKITKSPRPIRSKFNTTAPTAAIHDPKKVSHDRLQHFPNKRLDLGSRQDSPDTQHPPRLSSKSPQKEPRSVIDDLNTGAELLDAKRRELKSAFQKNAEKLRSSYTEYNDSDSDDSFFCSGDPASFANSEKHSTPKVQLAACVDDGRLRGLRTAGDKDSCRLCHFRSPAESRGICDECEKTYCSPQPNVFDCYEIKPTPPLKIRRKTVGRNSNIVQSTCDGRGPPVYMPSVKEKESRVLEAHDICVRPTVFSAPLDRRQSLRAVLEGIENISPLKRHLSHRVGQGRVERIGKGKKTVSKSMRWPVGGIRDAYEKGGKDFPKLPAGDYGSSTCESPCSSDEDQVSLLTGEKKKMGNGKSVKKRDSFYVFYDSLMRDLGVSTPKYGISAERYDEL